MGPRAGFFGDMETASPPLKVLVVPRPSCLVGLPLALHRREPPVVLLVEPEGGGHSVSSFVVGWGGGASARHDTIEVPAALAEAHGLRPSLKVRVRAVELPRVTSLWVCPESEADWAAAQQHASALQSEVLMQVFAANVGQRLPLWIHGSECVWMRVLRCEPEAPAMRLAAGMDLIVAPPANASTTTTESDKKEETPAPSVSRRLRVGHLEAPHSSFSVGLSGDSLRRLGAREGQLLLLRASGATVTTNVGGATDKRKASPPAHAFGYAVALQPAMAPSAHALLPLLLRRQLGGEAGSVISIRALSSPKEPSPICEPHRLTVHVLDASVPTRSPSTEHVTTAVKEWLSACEPPAQVMMRATTPTTPLPQCAVVELPQLGLVQMLFDSPEVATDRVSNDAAIESTPSAFSLSEGWFTRADTELVVGPCKAWAPTGATLGADLHRSLPSDWRSTMGDVPVHPLVLGGRRAEVARAAASVRGALNAMAEGAASGALMGTLITGARGVGKSAVADAIAEALRCNAAPGCAPIWTASISADALLAASQPMALVGRLRALLERACRCAPAVLIFEDLHRVFPAAAAVQDAVPIAESIAEMLTSFAHAPHRPPVFIAATATAADKVHDALRVPGLMDSEFRISMPDRAGRKRTLASLARHLRVSYTAETLAWAASATESFVAAELRQLIEIARLAAASRVLMEEGCDQCDAIGLCEADLRSALPHVTSEVRSAGKTAASAPDTGTSWAEIGALDQVKRVLFESVILPRDRPDLFAAAPLRLTSGALLYGHAGCGKTALAAALAAEAKLPFLPVKGPELLNKYIGASEAAVRSLFERASSCQPCILFFDEFEAIAPRRGQDSTGVTDRVVNQLLCELDGIESLHGVFVLAASNRPELIDPALLRPGRIDRKLLCSLPDRGGRDAILQALLQKVHCESALLSPEATTLLAERCDGFSGADLQALLADAQLAAIHEAQDVSVDVAPFDAPLSEEEAVGVRDAGVLSHPWLHAPSLHQELDRHAAATPRASSVARVCARHLDQALASAVPSISSLERERRDAAFRSFGAGAGPTHVEAHTHTQQRAIHA